MEKSISTRWPPSRSTFRIASAYRTGASSSPKNSSWSGGGTPNRKGASSHGAASSPGRGTRDNGSPESNPLDACQTLCASSQVRAKIDTQSRVRQAGTTPAVLSRPRVGLSPIKLLKAAGTRPEPAVSVPREKVTSPLATATAEPELEPPEMYRSSNTLEQAPKGERVPTNPVANWSIFVFPIKMAPASSMRRTTVALTVGL